MKKSRRAGFYWQSSPYTWVDEEQRTERSFFPCRAFAIESYAPVCSAVSLKLCLFGATTNHFLSYFLDRPVVCSRICQKTLKIVDWKQYNFLLGFLQCMGMYRIKKASANKNGRVITQPRDSPWFCVLDSRVCVCVCLVSVMATYWYRFCYFLPQVC